MYLYVGCIYTLWFSYFNFRSMFIWIKDFAQKDIRQKREFLETIRILSKIVFAFFHHFFCIRYRSADNSDYQNINEIKCVSVREGRLYKRKWELQLSSTKIQVDADMDIDVRCSAEGIIYFFITSIFLPALQPNTSVIIYLRFLRESNPWHSDLLTSMER